MKPAVFLLPLLALAGACAANDQRAANEAAALDKVTPATPVGPPESCVPLTNIRETRVQSDRVIDFHLRNGGVLRNTLPYSCPQLGFHRAFSYNTSLNQLCNVDIVTVIIQGGGPSRGASCGLGMFQPVELQKKK